MPQIRIFPTSPQDVTRLFANLAVNGGFTQLLTLMGWPLVDTAMVSTCTPNYFTQQYGYSLPPGPFPRP